MGWLSDYDTTEDLNYAGLTDQSGHNSDNMFLVFFREKSINATRSRLTIGSQTFEYSSENVGAYSSNVFNPIITYGSYSFNKNSDSVITDPFGRCFTSVLNEQGKLFTSKPLYYDDTVMVQFDKNNYLSKYIYETGGHRFFISLEKQTDDHSSYSISIDTFPQLITGEMTQISNEEEIHFQWDHQTPAWAKMYPFESIVTPDSNGYTLVIKSKR